VSTELEKLVVALEASMTKYEKAMNRALGISNTNAKKVEARWAKLNINPRQLFRDFTRGAVSALVPTLSLAAALNGAKTALKEFGDVADNSKAAGVDAEFFQALAYQAKQGGVEINETASALATFNKNSGLAVAGRGKMATALKAIDVGLLENIRNATTQEERIKLVADALSKEGDASRKAAIATAAFGDAGLKLVGVFAGGADEIERMQVKAKEMGLVVDRELIARADTLGDEFDTVTQIVHLQLMQALVDLGPVLVWLAGLAGNIAEQIGNTVDNLKPLAEQKRSTIEGTLAGIDLRQNDVNPAMAAGITPEDAAALKKPLLDELRRRAVEELKRQLTAVTPPTGGDLPTLEEIESRNEAAKAALREAERIKELIEQRRFENTLIGLSALEQAKLTAARAAGSAATTAQRDELVKLTEEGYRHEQQVEAMKTVYSTLGDIGETAVRGIISALADMKIEGEEAADILSNVLTMAGNFFLNQAFGSIGGGSTVLGDLFGGPRAMGGPVEAGKIYKVNENTPNSEYFAPGMDGVIIPKLARPAASAAAGAPVFNIDARGAQAGVGAEIRRELEHFSRFTLPDRVNAITGDPHARG
jgi:hypothetical protein